MMIRVNGSQATVAVLLMLAAAGCSTNTSRDTGEAMKSPKNGQAQPAQTTAQAPAPAVRTGGDAAPGLAWDAPADFERQTPSSQMRAAQYKLPSGQSGIKDGELAVFFFGPGSGGGTQANLERWAGQFKQDDGSDPMKKAKVDSFNVGALKVTTIELSGHYASTGMGGGPSYDEAGWRLFGAVVEGQGGPWFFKAVGPESVIAKNRDAIVKLLKGVRVTT